MKKNSIAFLITTLDLGGAETQLCEVAVRLCRKGWRCEVLCLTHPGKLHGLLSNEGIKVTALNFNKDVGDFARTSRLAHLLNRLNAQIVHSHLFHANILSRILRPLYRPPNLVNTIHNIWEGSRRRDLAYRLTDRAATVTTTVSATVAEHLRKSRIVSSERLRIIPNGVDTSRFSPNHLVRQQVRRDLRIQDDEFAWIAVGSFTRQKDFATLIRALARLRTNRGEFSLLLVGEGQLTRELESIALQERVGPRVRFLGARDDVSELLKAGDAFVLSSEWEGFPVALLEAASTALPTVATRVGGTPEIVVEGITGQLVAPASPTQLASAMEHVMSLSHSSRKAVGQAARRHIEAKFSIDRIVALWEAQYLQLLERSNLRGLP